jgi:pimeloyl-ACP methyl ester carboxylesterase
MRILLVGVLLILGGCVGTGGVVNPSFPVTEAEAQADERRMRADPGVLERPVVVIGSFRGPDPIVESMTIRLARMTTGRRSDFLRIPTWFEGDLEDLALRTVEMVESAFPSGNADATVEVDVVGLSMGGLVARYAADRLEGRRLKIRRLITIATPHRGAVMAPRSPLVEDRAVQDMYPRSLFLTKLDEAYDGSYEIIPYTRLGDGIVGTINTAPPGRWPIWTDRQGVTSHLTVNEDRRILADIARRLRGEEARGVEGEPPPGLGGG